METETYEVMFGFRMGARVRWEEYPQAPYVIWERRWTERAGQVPIVEYLVRGSAVSGWAYEEELEAWDES